MRCLVTGASGYVGGVLAAYLENHGVSVTRLQRSPAAGVVSYNLGGDIDPSALLGADALVHAAWDMKAVSSDEIQRVNVEGSRRLFEAAKAAGVSRIVFISSISAFPGCRSLYGQSKLAVEKIAASMGAVVIRPALVYGEQTGGMVGKLGAMVDSKSLLPVVAPKQEMFTCHADDLSECVLRAVKGELDAGKPVLAANPSPITMGQILGMLASRAGKKITMLPVPHRAVWLALRTAEAIGLRPNFKSDSLVGMMNPDPSPDFETPRRLGLGFRAFDLARGTVRSAPADGRRAGAK